MKKGCIIFFICFCQLVITSNSHAQEMESPFVTISGDVLRPQKMAIEDLKKMKLTEVKTTDRNGETHIYKGVELHTILDGVGVTMGSELRGKNLLKYLLLEAADGYKVIFTLAEIDQEYFDQIILLAFAVDGIPLSKEEGPFRLIVPNEKKTSRWIRQLNKIEVVAAQH